MDSIQCQQGAKELVYPTTVLEKRMVNLNSLKNNAIHMQEWFRGTIILLEKPTNRCCQLNHSICGY